MIPFTVEVMGRNEPIDCKKILSSENQKTGEVTYHLITADNRIGDVAKENIIIIWINEPSDSVWREMERLEHEGRERMEKEISTLRDQYRGVETQ